MTAQDILISYVVLSLLVLAGETMLTLLNGLNLRLHGGQVPPSLAATIGAEDAKKAAAYSGARQNFSLFENLVASLLVIGLAARGVFGALDELLRGSGLSGSSFLGAPDYVLGLAYLAILLVLQTVLSSPFSLYSTFSIERRFGFNRTKLSTWLSDVAKSALLGATMGAPLLYLLYRFVDGAGRLWWLWAALVFSSINLVVSLLYPALIAPLFNKFTPLAEGSLKEKIEDLARALDFHVSGIFVMDGSRRSSHSNAYFTGFGRWKRVVLFDTLIDGLSESELAAVLAHEIGHQKKGHVVKGTALSVALSFLSFWVLAQLMHWAPLYEAFGFAAESKHAVILILSLLSGPLAFLLTPLLSWWSRSHEYEADSYASDAVSGPVDLSSALVKLNRENASNLWPHPLYAFWYYSHPTLVNRLSALAGRGASR